MRLNAAAAPAALLLLTTSPAYPSADDAAPIVASQPCPDGMTGSVRVATRPGQVVLSGRCADANAKAVGQASLRYSSGPALFLALR